MSYYMVTKEGFKMDFNECCEWTCPVCSSRCGGIKGHEQKNLVHQCSNPDCKNRYDPTTSTDTYCPATITHKHNYHQITFDSDGNKKILKCSSCQYIMETK